MSDILKIIDLQINFKTSQGMIYALRGVNFTLQKGEIFAICGESGSGKSITSKAIAGLLPFNAIVKKGEILYENQDLTKITDKDFNQIRGRKITMIFQNPMTSLNPLMKAGKQIEEVFQIKAKRDKKNYSKTEFKKQTIQLMKEMGIDEADNKYHLYPHQLSGGICQRIVIAIALANESEILICDEPTTALDPIVQKQILELIKKITKERQLSVIFITHDLGVIASIADRAAVMYAGKIVEIGQINEIFYNAHHPYTWALLQSMPNLNTKEENLNFIEGQPPVLTFIPQGDAFAPRNPYALKIDFEKKPPMFPISASHFAATWLLHPSAPKYEAPAFIQSLRRKGGFI
ncbi:MAG: hypothetical protein PR2021_5150 [Candidatus Phytoplasma pruni]|uniref:ABC transporter ATP-binding protein n=1 Tax=Poinsettia branch-inducing phytoplasma TaxID=138647 RepID=UPI00036749AB|nr:ABC transporter ATP-binding protein [Poinsettia branch-inducing phytoplasma]WEK82580.1 MAG: hypothetical protein PR2021_5150 [Candidatus Phytoplasma pruni]